MNILSAAVWLTMLALGVSSGSASAQAYPSKPIRLITGAPGSATDVRARWIAERLTSVLGQPIIVDNRGGAGGTIGAEAAAKSTPDGYTVILVHQGTMALAPYEYLAWMGISAPAKTPKEVVSRLNIEIAKILSTSETRDWLATQGAEPGGDSPAEFAAFIKVEHARWGPIIRKAGIKPD